MKEALEREKTAVFWGTKVVDDKTVWFPMVKDEKPREPKPDSNENTLKL